MNRFTAAGLLLELAIDKRVLVLVGHMAEVRTALDAAAAGAEALRLPSVRVIRSNGNEQVRTSAGGLLRFISLDQIRNVAPMLTVFDCVFVEHTAAAVLRHDPGTRSRWHRFTEAVAVAGCSMVEA